jgi:alanine racemase
VSSKLPLRPAAALISKSKLRQNIQLVKECIRSHDYLHHRTADIMAIVKADAYGHDIKLVLPGLEEIGIKRFAVATLLEAIEARSLSASADILVLGGTLKWSLEALDVVRRYGLEVAVTDMESLKFFCHHPDVCIHLKLDTGMNRLGLKPSQWSEAISLLKKKKRNLEGVFTHFASSGDSYFLNQVMLFEEAVRWIVGEGFKPKYVHCENSGGLLCSPSLKRGILSELGSLVRTGIAMFGYAPRGVKTKLKIRPVLELVSEIGLVKKIEKGEGVSYGALYRAPKAHEYGVVPLGYADGISKIYAPKLKPQVRDRNNKVKGYVQVCGAICMDMVMLRPASAIKLVQGDQVVFWGDFPNPLLENKLVEPYELNLRIAKRLPRIWTR